MNASEIKKYFTVTEANAMLPLVRAIVDDIVRLAADVHERQERLNKVRRRHGNRGQSEDDVYSEELEQSEQDLDKDKERLVTFVDELEGLGVQLKDPLMGLVDFPTRIEGRDALLCWKHGEGDIAFWHELNAGFQGRQSLLAGSAPPPAVNIDKEEGDV
ncbi:MAG: DUF2203 domain-containing protein [Planctomycetaceae bacterium]